MPQRAEHSLATRVSVRKRMSGLWVEMRAMMSVWVWGVGFVLCSKGPGRAWLLLMGVWFWVRGEFVASREIVVGVMLRECVGFYPML